MFLFDTLQHLFHPRPSNNWRARVLHPEALIFVLGITLSSLTLVQIVAHQSDRLGAILGYASDITVEQVVALSNAERAKSGLPALRFNGTLSQSAAAKASDMFSNQYWAHTSPQGKEPWDFFKTAGYSYKVAGENLARDFSTTPDMMAAWMNSPTHRANIMNSRYEEIGIAVVNGTLNGIETTLVVQHFGSPSQAVAQIPSQSATAETTESTRSEPVVVSTATPTLSQASLSITPTLIVTTPTVSLLPPSDGLPVTQIAANIQSVTATPTRMPMVLSRMTMPGTSLANLEYSPLQSIKALGLSILLLLIVTLFYDWYAVGHYHSSRIVGKNLAHILILTMTAFLLIFFKAGHLGDGIMFGL